jgi:hypothetical protein
MSSLLTDEETSGIYGALSLLLHTLPSGKIRPVAGDAGFDLGQIRDGMADSGLRNRGPIESDIDGQWNTFDSDRKERTLRRLAEAIGREMGTGVVNDAILKYSYKFENGGFVPVNAAGEIPI